MCVYEDMSDNTVLPALYAIWVEGEPGGPFSGRSGFLSEEGNRLFFWDKYKADRKVRDLKNLRLNMNSCADLQCVVYPGSYDTGSTIASEELRSALLKPMFSRYTIQNRIYGNTGGGCMVATLKAYLPELNKTVWINCNLDGADLTSADYVWNEDHSDSWQRYEDVALAYIDFARDSPQTCPILAPLIQDAIAYMLHKELQRKPAPITFPAKWLPDKFREAYHETLAQAQKENADILILPGGGLQRCDGAEPTMQNLEYGGYLHSH